MYQLYKCDKNSKIDYKVKDIEKNHNLKVMAHRISLFYLLSSKHFFVNLYWYINTIGKCWIYTVYDGDIEAHHSHVTYKCYKFPFMKNEEIQISNGFTDEKYRGYGIYTFIMDRIVCDYLKIHPDGSVYGLVEEANIIPQKQLTKIGFVKTDNIVTKKMLGVLKIYQILPIAGETRN